MSDTRLYDVPGVKTRRRIWIVGTIGALLLLALAAAVIQRLAEQGQFELDLWLPFVVNTDLQLGLLTALGGTLQAMAYALGLALILGTLLACARLSKHAVLRVPAVSFVVFFRGPPLLLLIFFFYLGFPLAFGIEISALWALVLGLVLYNGAVICEIIRAGVLSLPRGQREAAYGLGLSNSQTLRYVLLPQAFRSMLPAIISQVVVLVKDTSLGFIVSYGELLRYGNIAIQTLDNPIQMYAVVAAIYIVLNSSLSALAHSIERRQSTTTKRQADARPLAMEGS